MICLVLIFWFGIFNVRVVFNFLLLYFLSHLFLLSSMICKFLVTIQKHHGIPYLNTPIYPNFIYHVVNIIYIYIYIYIYNIYI